MMSLDPNLAAKIGPKDNQRLTNYLKIIAKKGKCLS